MKTFFRALGLGWLLSLTALAAAASAENPGFLVLEEYLTIIKVTDANQFLAYSKQTGLWKKHAFDEGVKALPVVAGSVCAFGLSGGQISELVAVDERGNWRSVKLARPTLTECRPIVDRQVAAYVVDGRIYAFSPVTGSWDSIKSEGKPYLNGDIVTVTTEDTIAIFSAITGTWSEASLKSDAR